MRFAALTASPGLASARLSLALARAKRCSATQVGQSAACPTRLPELSALRQMQRNYLDLVDHKGRQIHPGKRGAVWVAWNFLSLFGPPAKLVPEGSESFVEASAPP